MPEERKKRRKRLGRGERGTGREERTDGENGRKRPESEVFSSVA